MAVSEKGEGNGWGGSRAKEGPAALACDATIDGEAVVCDGSGVADFERLHSREHNGRAFLWTFDLLELDGEDLRPNPLLERKAAVRRLLRRAKTGIHFRTATLVGHGSPIASAMPPTVGAVVTTVGAVLGGLWGVFRYFSRRTKN